MSMAGWGSVEGDSDADAILRDRGRDQSATTFSVGLFFIILVVLAVWYGLTGSRGVLGAEIVVAAICAAGWVRLDVHSTHSYVMIAEQRIRITEYRLGQLASELADIKRALRHS